MKGFNFLTNFYLFDSFIGLPEIISNVDKLSYEVDINKAWAKARMKLKPGIENLIQKFKRHY